jgi:DNA-binding PadR family transcriptional regulator
MTNVSPVKVLSALRKHETLTFPDLLLEKNLGFKAEPEEVEKVLKQLSEDKFIDTLSGAKPVTYTITAKGIEEHDRLTAQVGSLVM